MTRGALVAVAVSTLIAHAHADPLLPLTELRLANGLRVVIAPDPSASAVVVHVRYPLGAGEELAAQAGYTHLVERLMFAGSLHVKPGELERRIDAAGGWVGSVTTVDHLSVFEQVPPEALELALWLEAERMVGFVDAITDAGLARAQRELAAEWRSAYVDQPYALVAGAVQEALWPAQHGNAHLVLGDGHAIAHATRDAVRAFARERIRPTQATLVIAGRLDPAIAERWVKTYFGAIPPPARSLTVARSTLPPLATPRDALVNDPVPNVVVAFRMDTPYTSDALAIEVAARMLAGSRASRLQRLVDADLASEVHAEIVRQRFGCELHVQATPLAGADPARVAAAIRDEIAKLRAGPASGDEVQRAATALDSELVVALEGLAFRAEALASWVVYADTPRQLDTQRAKLRAVTPEAVQRAAAKWLADSASVTVIAKGTR